MAEMTDRELLGAVIVGVVPGQSPRVLSMAAQQASLHGVPLVLAYVDVGRFVTFEDPDGYVHTAPLDLNLVAAGDVFAKLTEGAREALRAHEGLRWSSRELVGDPALAIKGLAEKIDATLIVIGTRGRGLGESIREFFTGSVAARLAHRQSRPVLVVPLDEPVADDEEISWGDSA